MSLRLLHCRPDELAPWVPQLQALERDISYPLAEDRFVIAHGGAYHPFFSALGEAHFLLALDGDRVVGCLAGVRKAVSTPRGPLMGAYLGDLKVHRDWRGQGVPARLYARALTLSVRDWGALHWRFAFGAAMRGDRGDVMRSARGMSLLKLGRPQARLDVYFVPPAQLAALELSGAPPPPGAPGLDLSPAAEVDTFSTAGTKDFVLVSTGQPWRLVHLPRGPRGWGASHAAYLRCAGAQLAGSADGALACFALDQRLGAERAFLAARGLTPGGLATVYALSTSTRPRGAAWTHLATSEI